MVTWVVGRRWAEVLLGCVACQVPMAAAQAQVLSIESEYALRDSFVDWTSQTTIPTVFNPIYGEQSERPFFAALGTLVSSRAQLFVGTKTNINAGCVLQVRCGDSTSALRFTHVATGQFIGTPTLTLTSQGQFVASNYPPPEVDFMPSYLGRMENNSGWQVTPAGPEPLQVRHQLNLAPGVWMEGNGFQIEGQLGLIQRYIPHSVGRYIQDGVRAAAANGATTNLSAAAAAAGYVRVLRTSSGETSGNNQSLRNAEYELYGYGSGLAFRSGQVFSFGKGSTGDQNLNGFVGMPLVQTPAGAGGYHVVKQLGRNIPGLKSAWTALFGAPPGQTTQLPGTTDVFGGLGSNTDGFLHGLRGDPVTTLGGCIDVGACGDDPPPGPNRQRSGPVAIDAAGQDSAVAPVVVVSDSTMVDGSTVTATLYAQADPQATHAALRLPAFDDHLFTAIGGGFAGFRLLSTAAAATAAWLAVTDGTQDLLLPLGAGRFSFLALLGQPVQTFALFGLDVSQLVGDTAGIELVFDGRAPEFVQTISISAVPEPAAALLLALGLALGLAAIAARRQPLGGSLLFSRALRAT